MDHMSSLNPIHIFIYRLFAWDAVLFKAVRTHKQRCLVLNVTIFIFLSVMSYCQDCKKARENSVYSGQLLRSFLFLFLRGKGFRVLLLGDIVC